MTGEFKRSLLDRFWVLHRWKHHRAQILEEEDYLKKNKKMEENKEAPLPDLLLFSLFSVFLFLLMVAFLLPFMF